MDTVLKIIDETTALTTNVDLFAYEIPLATTGLWLADAQTDSRFNSVNAQEFDCYLRNKTKASGIANIKYLKDTIDGMSGSDGVCVLADGTQFKLEMLFNWDFLEKDAEGYYVWASRLRLIL